MIYVCDNCNFIFTRTGSVEECPNCGKLTFREATEEECEALENKA